MKLNEIERPYFLENKDWYYYDGEEFQLTKKGKEIKEVVESYNQFKIDIDKDDE